jgi:hypothetical protein
MRTGIRDRKNVGSLALDSWTERKNLKVFRRRANKGPLFREREHESSRKADKSKCRDDFQLHTVSYL